MAGWKLAGGLYGVTIGGAFFGESMFHHIRDASKIALLALVERLRARRFTLLDTQWLTPHLEKFGAIEIPRPEYLHLLNTAVNLPRKFGDDGVLTNPGKNSTMTKRKRVVRRRQGVPSIISKRPTNTNKRVSRWICAALVVLAVLPYLQTLGHEFVNFDDGAYVAENPLVQQGLTWSNVAWAFTTMSAGNWHPLTWLSHMLDCQIFGLRPGWHHLVNALLHGANTALLFVVLRTMTGMAWRSALVAALFAVHPLHVESVAWIAERKDVLSTFFGLLAMWAYARYAGAPSLMRYGLVACFFALSLLSKPMLVTLPFVLLLLDVWPLKRFWIQSGAPIQKPKLGSLFLEKLPLLAMSAASSVVTFKAQHAGGAMAPIDILPLSQRLANAIIAYVGYLTKAFWPVDLAVLYPLPVQTSVAKTVLAILVIVGITIGVGVLIRKRPWLAVGWLWFLGTLVPVIGLVQVGDSVHGGSLHLRAADRRVHHDRMESSIGGFCCDQSRPGCGDGGGCRTDIDGASRSDVRANSGLEKHDNALRSCGEGYRGQLRRV